MRSTQKIADALLVLEYQSGNKKALSVLVKKWHVKLCRQALWYTKDMETAKDVAQESWSTIVFKLYTLKDPDSFGSWALTVVNRKAIDWLRKAKNAKKRVEEHTVAAEASEDPDGDESEVKKQKMRMLNLAIKQLPDQQQIVLHLFYIEDYSLKQIAKILGVSTGTVKSRLFHAREKLKTLVNT